MGACLYTLLILITFIYVEGGGGGEHVGRGRCVGGGGGGRKGVEYMKGSVYVCSYICAQHTCLCVSFKKN